MIWVGHVACMVGMRNEYNVLVGKYQERCQFGDLGVDGRIILKWSIKTYFMKVWIGVI
jgi:hypothetical protein